MKSLRMVIVGPGRAGGSLALAAARAGHRIVGVVPGPSGRIPRDLEDARVVAELPGADLLVLAVRDDAIDGVASRIAAGEPGFGHVCHLSGLTSVEALAPFRERGSGVGSFHPVQSLPDPESGSVALAGSYAALTGDRATLELLRSLALSLGMAPFVVEDHLKPMHHAAASAASNFVVAALAVAAELAVHAGVPAEAYHPLTAATVANAHRMGPAVALTGPVARGDVRTVTGQLDAAGSVSPEMERAFGSMVLATAAITPHEEMFRRLLRMRP